MDDLLQVSQRDRIREDQASERGAIERPIGAKQVRPEPGDDRVEGRFARLQNLPCHDISVNDDDSWPLRQPTSHGRLPAADWPGDPDPD
jgi:hypothetical protein